MSTTLRKKQKVRSPVLRLMSGDLSCAICRAKILQFDKKERRDETFALLNDGRSVHCRCLRNDLLDEYDSSKRRARMAAKANGILAKKRDMNKI